MTYTTSASRSEVTRIVADLNIQGVSLESEHGRTIVHVRERDARDLVVELHREGHDVDAGRPRRVWSQPSGFATASSFIRRR